MPDLIQPAQPPKDPILILVLNLLVFGCAGYFLLGQKMKGIVAIIVVVITAIPTWCMAPMLIAITASIDGYLQAKQLQEGRPIGNWTFFQNHS